MIRLKCSIAFFIICFSIQAFASYSLHCESCNIKMVSSEDSYGNSVEFLFENISAFVDSKICYQGDHEQLVSDIQRGKFSCDLEWLINAKYQKEDRSIRTELERRIAPYTINIRITKCL